MWVPHSLAYRTDLMFPRFDGRVRDGGDYLVVESPSNPGYYWGNFLLFQSPPRAGDAERWPAAFAHELGTAPGITHVSLGWGGDERGEIQPLLDAGYRGRGPGAPAAGSHAPPPDRRGRLGPHERAQSCRRRHRG